MPDTLRGPTMGSAMGERAGSRATPRVDLGAAGESAPRPDAPETRAAPPGSLRLVLRPAVGWRALGPVLVLVGIMAGVLLSPLAFVISVLGLALLPLFLVRVECDGVTLRRRRIRGWEEPVAVSDLVALRVRRAPFAALAHWRHSFRFGHYCTVPLRLRLHTTRGVALDLTVVWWDGWLALARFVRSQPDVEVDRRSRARLERL